MEALQIKNNTEPADKTLINQLLIYESELFLLGNILFKIVSSYNLKKAEKLNNKGTALTPLENINLGWIYLLLEVH
ncbi:MAG TPA: hypothetical protein VIK72_05360 [Clostridiaceae bacterium]